MCKLPVMYRVRIFLVESLEMWSLFTEFIKVLGEVDGVICKWGVKFMPEWERAIYYWCGFENQTGVIFTIFFHQDATDI